jgi:hypothetical protein
MIAACLSLVQENKDLSNFAASILLLSLIFPIVAAPFARAAYHRRATRLMKFREVRSPPAAWWERRERHFARSAPAANIEKTTPEAFAGIMRHRLQRIRRATFAAYTTFVVGTGLSVPLHYSADAAEYAIGAAALAIGPVLINATPRTTPRWLILVVAALLTISMVFDPLEDYRAVAVAFGLVFAFYLVATNRTFRALYVPHNILGLGGITGFILGMISPPTGCASSAIVCEDDL